MTPEQLDALFPHRRAECEALDVSADTLFIPRAAGTRWNAAQCQAIFPDFPETWRDFLAQQAGTDAATESDVA